MFLIDSECIVPCRKEVHTNRVRIILDKIITSNSRLRLDIVSAMKDRVSARTDPILTSLLRSLATKRAALPPRNTCRALSAPLLSGQEAQFRGTLYHSMDGYYSTLTVHPSCNRTTTEDKVQPGLCGLSLIRHVPPKKTTGPFLLLSCFYCAVVS
jgi:hypothetical protein